MTGDSPRHLVTIGQRREITPNAYNTFWFNEELSHHDANSTSIENHWCPSLQI